MRKGSDNGTAASKQGVMKPTATSRGQQTAPSQPPPSTYMGTPPLSQLERLVTINKRLSEPDRARFSQALYDFGQMLDRANSVWGKANNVDSDLGPKDFDLRKTRLREVLSLAKDYEQAFRDLRRKWNYYEDQMSYVFGDNPDNDAAIISNAANKYLYFLSTIEKLQSQEEKPLLDLLADEQNQYHPFIDRFQLWRQECGRRLQQMRDSIQ